MGAEGGGDDGDKTITTMTITATATNARCHLRCGVRVEFMIALPNFFAVLGFLVMNDACGVASEKDDALSQKKSFLQLMGDEYYCCMIFLP